MLFKTGDDPAVHEPAPLDRHARDDLRYIRETMARAGAFSAVPGWGMVLVGATAFAASAFASGAHGWSWLATWGVELLVALAITVVAVPLKARATGEDVGAGPARRFFTSFLVPALAALALTVALARAGAWDAIPGTWLALYGCALVAGWGALTREVVPLMGLTFAALGALALLWPAAFWLALGFGAVHVLFGLYVARRYGG